MFYDLCILCNYRNVDVPPRWSGVGDDCTPFEYSIVLGTSKPDMRLIIEAQDDPASPVSYWNAGMKLNEWLLRKWNVDLQKVHRISDLFVPTDSSAYVAMGHGIEFTSEGPPHFKIYLNPLAQGTENSQKVVFEALSRLGFSELFETLSNLRGPRDLFSHISMDLSSSSDPRIKVYIRHWDASLDELEARCAVAIDSVPGDWSLFCNKMTGGQASLSARSFYTVYHLKSNRLDRPVRSVLILPVFPYAANDNIAYKRIRSLLEYFGIPHTTYSSCVKALLNGLSKEQQGLHSYISIQHEVGKPRITVYFSPRLYFQRYGWLAMNPKHCWPSPIKT
jgi:hypothetical protein